MATAAKSPNADAFLWVGAAGGSWGSASNWDDTTAGTSPAPYVPGTLTPVTVTGPAGPAEAILGGGSAYSLGLTGNVGLGGGYALGGEFRIGSLTVTPMYVGATTALAAGSLALAAGGTVTANSVNVPDGTLALAGSAGVSAAGGIAVGLTGGDNVLYNGSYVHADAASGTVDLNAGAALSTPGALTLNSGFLNDTGGTVGVGGALTVGTAATPASSVPYTEQASGQVVVTSGGTLAVGGGITDNSGIIVVDGAGSKLTAGGTLTGIGGNIDGVPSSGSPVYAGSIAAGHGGFVRLGGAAFNAPVAGYAYATPGLSVDAASTVEIGAAGGAASGAITVDAGRAITANTDTTLRGALVDNGAVTAAGGILIQGGNVSGSGVLQIGRGGTLAPYGTVAATNAIAFLDTGATLAIGAGYGASGTSGVLGPYRIDATLTGFRVGDSITVSTPVTAAAFAIGQGGGPGTLTLSDGAATVETLRLAGDFAGKTFLLSPLGNGSVSVSLADGPVGAPVLSSPTLAVAGGAAATALGIAAPRDPNYAAGQLSITVASLPGNGTVTLADGTTAVAAGQALTSDQLIGLRFRPAPGLFNASSAFTYVVSDPANNAATGTATLAIGPAPTPGAEFDAAYYLRNNPDVAAAGIDPLQHFNRYGWKEGRNPDALFNVQYYLNQNPGVAAARVNPLTHYETTGWKEGRDPSVNFSTAAYLKANPDVALAHIDPLQHYIAHGSQEGRMAFAAQPHGVGPQDPLVDNAYYFSHYPDVSVSGVNPFTQYDTAGWRQGRNPDALFDTNYYLQHNPDVKAAMTDPLLHYERYGWKEGRDPSAQFSTSKYLAANADVKAAGLDPLVHYEQHGMQEGRAIFPV